MAAYTPCRGCGHGPEQLKELAERPSPALGHGIGEALEDSLLCAVVNHPDLEEHDPVRNDMPLHPPAQCDQQNCDRGPRWQANKVQCGSTLHKQSFGSNPH